MKYLMVIFLLVGATGLGYWAGKRAADKWYAKQAPCALLIKMEPNTGPIILHNIWVESVDSAKASGLSIKEKKVQP